MTKTFALDLSLDGIRLLYLAEGGWTVVGDAAIEDPALAQRLSDLRAEAERLAGGLVTTELVIPSSQIRYATVPRPAADPVTAADLAAAIAGLTPLDLTELAFDWEVEGAEVRIALVDRQTLDEAEAFATAYGFNPAGFGARPTPAQFPRIPDFGRARGTAAVLAAAPAPAPAPAATRSPAPAVTPRVPAPAPQPGAEALARSLSAPRPNEVPRPKERAAPPSAWRPRLRSVALGAGGLAVAAVALAVALGRPSDPAASLPDIAPEVALSLPALAEPGSVDATPAAPAAIDDAPVAVETVAVPPPAAVADPAAETEAPAALAEVPPARVESIGPARPAPPASGTSETIYLASIDPVTRATDAIALPAVASFAAPARPAQPTPPAAAGGATAEPGTPVTASLPEEEPVVVVEGRPPLAPPPRAVETPAVPDEPEAAQPEVAEVAASLPDRRPRARPEGLAERYERAIFAGRTRAEMAALRPLARPVSEQAAAVEEAPAPPTDQAVARSLQPRDRPADFATRIATAQAVAAALAAPEPQPAPAPAPQVAAAAPPPAPAAPQAAAAPRPQASAPAPEDEYDDGETDVASAAPNIPTTASVARQATIRNAMSLREINLIGVYGTERDRRALVRLSNGRFVKVQVGDRLDGGRIAAIGRDELRYTKGGRNITLSVPSG